MSSPNQQEMSTQRSEIAKFFDGKSIFITGAAGFLGMILLEVLLRCCPGICRIYILLRQKKGVLPENRKELIFKKEIFYKVKEKNPRLLEKVTVLPGDVTQDNLGMSDDDFFKVIKEVTIVFHCAASINFLKPLRFTILNNVIATIGVIELCHKLKKLDALVYTSTAFSNCNRWEIDENIYRLPFSTDDILEAYRKDSDEELMHFFSLCKPKFPNFYTFSKCLAENILADKAADLPVAIVRPSLIGCVWKGVLPGYVEEGSGMISLSIGIGKGFIRVVRVDGSKKVDHVPVDVVANTHVISAWAQTTQRLQSPCVYNCVSSPINACTWTHLNSTLFLMMKKYPLPKAYQKPSVVFCKNPIKYWFMCFLDHYVPAVVIDVLLWISGRKSRLFKLYRFYDKVMSITQYFSLNEWNFQCENFKLLSKKLNVTDAELFPVDLEGYSVEAIARVLPTGAPFYTRDSDTKPYKERIRTTYMRYFLTTSIKWTVLGCILFSLYAIVF